MVLTQPMLLTLTLTLGYEYTLKQWWETLSLRSTKSLLSYLAYRLVHLVLLTLTAHFLSTGMSLVDSITFSSIFVILGSLEVPLNSIINRIERVAEIRLYQLNYLMCLCIIFLVNAGFVITPRFDVDYEMIFLFVFLAHPANYFIRWALGREVALQRQADRGKTIHARAAEVEAAVTDTEHDVEQEEHRAKVGRRIGTIERWLIVLLIATQNASSIGLVITAKSIVRYPQLSDKQFAEYYLFGTLLSVILAVLSGFLVLGGT